MILLDTNVVSELMKPQPDPRVTQWVEAQVFETLFLSAITLAEMRAGIEIMPIGKRRSRLRERFERDFLPLFTGRVLGFDQSCTIAYAEHTLKSRRKGYSLSVFDSLLAAIAATHVMSVATRDTRPFNVSGVSVINPWDL